MTAHTCPDPFNRGRRCKYAGQPHQVTADGRLRHYFVKEKRS